MDLQQLIAESEQLEEQAAKIQKGDKQGLTNKEIQAFVKRYDQWYARCLAVLPDSDKGLFAREYEGSTFSSGIRDFLNQPTTPSPIKPTPETASIWPYWQFPYENAFKRRIRAQRAILRAADERQQAEVSREMSVANTLHREIAKGLVFIAMPMIPTDPMLDDVHDGIKQVAAELGLSAERVDDSQTNERITLRIMQYLASAEFVIADLTHNRPNVYFEAGYAEALGKTPVYIARKDTKLEFDVNDYPVIFFDNIKSLRSGLSIRLKSLMEQRNAGSNPT